MKKKYTVHPESLINEVKFVYSLLGEIVYSKQYILWRQL